jgi:hypothetical protein
MQKQDKPLADVVVTALAMAGAQSAQWIPAASKALAGLPSELNFKSRAHPSRLTGVISATNSPASSDGAVAALRIRLSSASGDSGAHKVNKFMQGTCLHPIFASTAH